VNIVTFAVVFCLQGIIVATQPLKLADASMSCFSKFSMAELAFYDALETNDSAVQVIGNDRLRTIAHGVSL
jgi:Domain of unknown function (DUF3387)